MNIQEIKATKPSGRNSGNRVERMRVAAYCRVSTDEMEQMNSYDSQIKYYSDLIHEKKEWIGYTNLYIKYSDMIE